MGDARPDAPDPMPGRVLDGRYRIEAAIGSGGIGTVYRAIHLNLERPVAIKVLRPEFASESEFLARFDREARALSRLAHVNVVTVTDFGVSEGFPYLVMELLSGRSLEEEIDRGEMTLARAAVVGRQILVTLAYAHAQGVVHRDLKPQNVTLVDQPGMRDLVKILDFGLAKIVGPHDAEGDKTLTRHGAIFGTPAYMSPEQAEGHPADARSDLYSAGVLIFEMLAGRPPFVTESTSDLLRHHILTRPPRMGDVAPLGTEIPELFERMVARALQKDRGARFQDAEQMLEAFEEAARVAGLGTSVEAGAAGSRRTAARVSGVARTMPATPMGLARRLSVWRLALLGRRALQRVRERLADPRARLAAIGGGGLVVVLLVIAIGSGGGPSSDPAPPSPRGRPPASAEAPAPAPRPPPPPARPPPRDPWRGGGVAAELRTALARLDAGEAEAAGRVTKVYVKEHRGDPLGHLALGHGYCARGWRRDCLMRYRIALRLDESVRGDPRMLSEVVTAMGDTRVSGDAAEILRVVFGDDAVPALVLATTEARTVEGGHMAAKVLAELGKGPRVDAVAMSIADLTRARRCPDRVAALALLRATDDPRVRPALEALRTNLGAAGCLGDALEQAIRERR
jgi:serine/threonine-protein kinase